MKKVFRKIGSTEEIPYSSQAVEIEKQVVCKVRQPLWDSQGKRLSIEELASAGLEVFVYPDQTEYYNNYHAFTALYTANADLEPRVLEYKACFDELGISYDSNTDQIEAAMNTKFGEDATAKAEFYTRIQTALTNVKVNYQAAIMFLGEAGSGYVTADDFITWLHTPLLIQFMPSANPEVPEYREPYVATVETEAAEKAENTTNAQNAEELAQKMEENLPSE